MHRGRRYVFSTDDPWRGPNPSTGRGWQAADPTKSSMMTHPSLLESFAMLALLLLAIRFALPVFSHLFKVLRRNREPHPYAPFELDVRPHDFRADESRFLIDRSTFTDHYSLNAVQLESRGTQAGYLSPVSASSSESDFIKV
ncbi:hypothetical protein FOZ63_003569 [Perkinsus olseni]|uniref:Uncharacterized protein n=1 Tax=Perkinsus olseni TaxID=32597 RepID=A0A7J6Q7V2_PEROL|nr:hypothetical protein FOZ63_003569 [Perkinsus olseni]